MMAPLVYNQLRVPKWERRKPAAESARENTKFRAKEILEGFSVALRRV